MPKHFFTPEQQQRIVEAIRHAEMATSGEVRVHVEPQCKGDAYERAKTVFEQLGMHATELKNGVLFYVAYQSKKYAVIGDKGIHEKVTQSFWDEVKDLLSNYFNKQDYTEGLCKAIALTGEKLTSYFPHSASDINELSNDISYGEDEIR